MLQFLLIGGDSKWKSASKKWLGAWSKLTIYGENVAV